MWGILIVFLMVPEPQHNLQDLPQLMNNEIIAVTEVEGKQPVKVRITTVVTIEGGAEPMLVIKETHVTERDKESKMIDTHLIAGSSLERVQLHENKRREGERRFYVMLTYARADRNRDAYSYEGTSAPDGMKSILVGLYTRERALKIKEHLQTLIQ